MRHNAEPLCEETCKFDSAYVVATVTPQIPTVSPEKRRIGIRYRICGMLAGDNDRKITIQETFPPS